MQGDSRRKGRTEENQERDKQILAFFKRGGHGTAEAMADRFQFETAQSFRMYTFTLRQVYSAPVFSHAGEYAWHSDRNVLLAGAVRQHKRGFGYILRGGRLMYELYLTQAEKDAAKLEGAKRSEILEEISAARAYLDGVQTIIRDMNRRLGAPIAVESGTIQLSLLAARLA